MATPLASLDILISASSMRLKSDMDKIGAIVTSGSGTVRDQLTSVSRNIQNTISKDLKGLGISAEGLVSKLGGVGLAVAGISAGVGISTLIGKFNSAVESAAKLEEISEKTGASVEKLSAIAPIAKIAGQDVESLAGGMVKLAKNMEATGGPSKATADALGRIGLGVKDLKGLDSASMMQAIAVKMSEFADGAGKTAIAVELFGKKGAEMLPTLKLMGETGDLVTKTTKEQAAAADEYEKNLVRLTLTKDALYKTISLAVLPVANAFVKALIDLNNETNGVRKAAKDLADDGTIREWAESGAIFLGYFVDAAQEAGGMVRYLGAVGAALKTTITNFDSGKMDDAWKNVAAVKEETKNAQLFTQRLKEQFAARKELNAEEAKKTLGGGNTGTVANKEGDSFLKALEARTKKMKEGEYAALMMQAEQKGVLQTAMPLIEKIQQLDELKSSSNYEKTLAIETKAMWDQVTVIGKTTQEVAELNIVRKNELELQKQITDIERTKGALTDETLARMTAASKAATEEQIAALRAKREAENDWTTGANSGFQKYIESSENAAKLSESALTNAFSGVENAFASFVTTGQISFQSFATSIVSDMTRMMMKALVLGPLMKAMGFGVSGGGGSNPFPNGPEITALEANGGAWNNGVKMFATGGVVSRPTAFGMAGGGTGVMGEAGPEAIMPLGRDSKGRLGVIGGGGGGSNVTVIVNNNADGTKATATETTDSMGNRQIEVMVANLVNKAISTGKTDNAMRASYGMRRVAS